MTNQSELLPVNPSLEIFIRLQVDVGLPTSIESTVNGERKLIPIMGGTFSGNLHGTILPGGSDAIVIRPDGCAQLNARYCLQLESGGKIFVEDKGYRHGPEFVMARLAQGQPVDPKQYYFRTCMTMETAEKDLLWLNKSLFIGSGCRRQKNVVIDLYRLL